MSNFHLRVNSKGFAAFDTRNRHRLTVSDEQARIDSASVNLNVQDPARITTQGEQMNPMGRHVASTIVSPQPTWMTAIPKINIAMTMILAIVAIAHEIEESESGAQALRTIRRTDYQIFNFEDTLPENVGS